MSISVQHDDGGRGDHLTSGSWSFIRCCRGVGRLQEGRCTLFIDEGVFHGGHGYDFGLFCMKRRKAQIVLGMVLLIASIGGTSIQEEVLKALMLCQSQRGLIGRSPVLDVNVCSRYRLIRRAWSVVIISMKYNATGIF